MNYEEVLKEARNCIGDSCKVCPVCNGRGCRNRIPGPGAKGVGDTAIRNYDKWQEIRVNMDTLHENVPGVVREEIPLSLLCRAGGCGKYALQ